MGVITDITTGKTYKAQPFPPFIQNIIKNGGLLNSLKRGESAVSKYLDKGYRTADIMNEGTTLVGCKRCGELICNYLRKE